MEENQEEQQEILQETAQEEPQGAPQEADGADRPAEEAQEDGKDKEKKRKKAGQAFESALLAILVVLAILVAGGTILGITGSILLSQPSDPGAAASTEPGAAATARPSGETKSTYSVFKENGLLSEYPNRNPTDDGGQAPSSAAPQSAAVPQSGSGSGGENSATYSRDNWPSGKLLGTTNSDKYHSYNCIGAQRIPPENEIWFDSVADAEAAGYQPCGTCYR